MTIRASDIMDRTPPTVAPDVLVKDLSQKLLDERLDGVCVVRDGELVGVVTAMDLIFQEQPVHMPSFFVFLDALIPLENPRRAEHDLEKIAGARVGDIMSTEIRTATPQTPAEDLARLMVEHHVSIIPVVDGTRLVGVVDKRGMLRAAFTK
jgi:CBS domain-containing protein